MEGKSGGWIEVNGKDILGKKLVDKSVFDKETTVYKKLVKNFLKELSNKNLAKGESQEITLIVDHKEFTSTFRYVNRKGRNIYKITYRKELSEYLKEKLHKSYKYIFKYKEDPKIEKPHEYIEFYKTDKLNTFRLELIPDDNYNFKEQENGAMIKQVIAHSSEDNKELKKISNIEESNYKSKDVIEYIHGYIEAKGYEYSKDIIKNLYLSLKTKPFVILYGISGTGKSKLVELFAKSIGASKEDGTFNLIPVRPDWSDASELIGYRNIEGKFQPGILTNIISNAIKHREIPYFVCLDEMNLARVEYYFSDILSIIETRDKINDEIKTDKLIRKELLGSDSEALKNFENLYIPENLYIIGTVNMDETTFPFSKKVLDRANTIEFNEVSLDYDFDKDENKETLPNKVYSNKLLRSDYIKIAQCRAKKDIAKNVIAELKEINKILEKCDMQFAYRIRDEVVFYVIYAVNEEIMDFDKALDYEIKQKILPRIGGSSNEMEKCLLELFMYCSKINKSNFTSDCIDEDTLSKMSKYLEEDREKLEEGSKEKPSCKYPISSEKILKMLWRFNRDGFTTFW